MIEKKRFAAIALLLVLFASGCATHVKTPDTPVNPPPLEAFSKFSHFVLKPINETESCDKQHGADVALRTIQEKLDVRLGHLVREWNAKPARAGKRTLIIEPICSDAKMLGVHARIWGGALAGSSAIVMKVRYSDAGSGKVIAEPVFYQRASAMSGAWTFGAADRNMLERLANLISSYTSRNYDNAVGGSTGS